MELSIQEKQCAVCKKMKSLSEFYFQIRKSGHIYYDSRCKECCSNAALIWKKNNPEKVRESDRKRMKNPQRKQYSKQKNEIYREKGGQREYYKNNKEKYKEYIKNHTDHIVTEDEWLSCLEYFNWSCAYCGYTYEEHLKEHGQQLHKEHVNHDGNDYIDNCIPACRTCNTSKHDANFNDWYNENNPLFSKRRLNKIIKWVTVDWMNYTE